VVDETAMLGVVVKIESTLYYGGRSVQLSIDCVYVAQSTERPMISLRRRLCPAQIEYRRIAASLRRRQPTGRVNKKQSPRKNSVSPAKDFSTDMQCLQRKIQAISCEFHCNI